MSELKNQELPPLEGVELYMQQAREFLATSAKMDDAPIPWMIAAAFKNEAENKRLRAELKAKDTERERLMDLVRHQRVELFAEELIDEDEYAAICADNDHGRRVARLESYDQLRAAKDTELAAKEARIAELTDKVAKRELWLKEHSEALDKADDRAEAAESKLGAVSEVLKEKVDSFTAAYALLGRLRSIVEGK